jgi:hypothetical protein
MELIYDNAFLKSPPKTITNKTIVLDLDRTLIATQDIKSPLHNILKNSVLYYPIRTRLYEIDVCDLDKKSIRRRGLGTSCEMWGLARPYYQEFLKFCFKYFKYVVVWSAGRAPYVEEIVEFLFRGLPHPHAILTYDDLLINGKYHSVKNLNKVASLLNVDMSSILALDDNEDTFLANPKNGILIPGYNDNMNENNLKEKDDALLKLKTWLKRKEVIESDDVKILNKNNIF